MGSIRDIAIKEAERYKESYIEFCKKNPGYIMHGDSIKQDAMDKASYSSTIDELRAMRTFYDIGCRQMVAKNTISGFRFCRDAIDELIKLVEDDKTI